MLEATNLSVNYGGLHALSEVSIKVGEGQLVAIVGANGAGKTTFFKAVSGTAATGNGTITFDGQNLLAVKPHDRPHLGIAHVPEGRRVFSSLSVMENIVLGAYTEAGRRDWEANLEFILELFPILWERQTQAAGTLSGGQQQMLAIARGLAASPRLLLLDEPSMGLAPALADDIFDAISRIHKERGMTVLLVEQRVAEALDSCDFAYLLESGRIAEAGSSAALMTSDIVRSAYLGL